MNQQQTVIQGIITTLHTLLDKVLGPRYYVIIVGTRGTDKYFVTSDLFLTLEAAQQRRDQLAGNQSYYFLEMHTFRSRRIQTTTHK